ncbi:MAG: hypothetical protein Q8S00_18930 [Deltaproteobacteria bacterium]|nr:hypothetical protein [Deltaproteobacteria bacterium]MDZ4345491.1 hypothetical protein [Candidatus Binatia bacterium]
MGKLFAFVLSVLMIFSPVAISKAAELQPVVSVNLFGGAERGSGASAGGIGGGEILGLLPLADRIGLQGSVLNQGGNGGHRLGVSLGPVYAYSSGKVGLFGDYVHENRGDNNFFYLRGIWSHYFTNFDLALSYTQPVNSLQHTRVTVIDRDLDGGQCNNGVPFRRRTVNRSVPAINELKGIVRYYPTAKTEINAGLLVNSFAGPGHNDPGTGFGGVFGFAFQALDWLIIRPIQGQMDTRERYRITSGVELVWAPAQQVYGRSRAQENDTSFGVASTAGGTFSSCRTTDG